MSTGDSLTFLDPHLEPGRRFVTVPATGPSPIPRVLASYDAEIVGEGRTRDLAAWLEDTCTTALLVTDGPPGEGRVLTERYGGGAGPETLLLGASMTKSVLAHLVGIATTTGALSLTDRVVDHVPELARTGWGGCTVADVASMTSGTAWVEDHRDPSGQAVRLLACFTGSGDSRALLLDVRPAHPPGSRWEYSTADSQVLDWVRERATGVSFVAGVHDLWARLGCVRDAAVSVDERGVALAGGGLAACAEDWLRLAALQLTGEASGVRVLDPAWVETSSSSPLPWLEPGRLPSSITAHAGFGYHWWPLDAHGRRVTADGMRGQFGYVDHPLGVAVLKTSQWPHEDPLVDRQLRDLVYLGLPVVASAAASSARTSEPARGATT